MPPTMTILLTGQVDESRMAELQAIAPQAALHYCQDNDALADRIAEADVVLGSVPESAFAQAAKLRWVHTWLAGPDRQLFPAMVASPVVVTCSKSNGAIPLAEHAIWLMLTLNRDALRWIEAQRARRWERHRHGELNGLTVGIIGTGYSGQDLALKAKAFHMKVLGVRRQEQATPGFDRIYPRSALREFLAACDFVVMTAPLTSETKGMLGEAEFRAMKPTAYYVCFSRGGIADDDALLRALREGWIAGAGLDAHGVEPLPEDSPFWSLPNVIVTPHNGATTRQSVDRAYFIFRDNLARFVKGEPLINVVDKTAGY